MMRCVFKDMHVIHHILDQEQTPAARRLQSGKVGLNVRFNRIRSEKAGTSMVNDAHQERFIHWNMFQKYAHCTFGSMQVL